MPDADGGVGDEALQAVGQVDESVGCRVVI